MNEKQLCRYVEEWAVARCSRWIDFRNSVVREKYEGIYKIDGGYHLMDIIWAVSEIVKSHFCLEKGTHLIPTNFSSPHQLIRFLFGLRDYAQNEMDFVRKIPSDFQDYYEVRDTYDMLDDVYEMADYCCKSYEVKNIDNSYWKPYLDMKACLDEEDIGGFRDILYSIYKDIPCTIQKSKLDEAYFHSIAHAVMYQLGFRLCSEKATCDGRMDMKIEQQKQVYIVEFKYSSEDQDNSKEAIQQIKNMQYADPYLLQKKRVIAVGITFGQKQRNIIGYAKEVLS
jgi:hypothetical protein